MKSLLRNVLTAVSFFAACGPVNAGEWDCDRARKFHLDVRGVESAQVKDSDRKWVESLISNLREQGGVISAVDVFVRSDATLMLNGAPSDCPVLQLANGAPEVFYVECEGLVVDFRSQNVLSLGSGGLSAHASPSKSVAALVHSTAHQISGVPVGPCFTPPHFFWNPWFSGSEVWWY